LQRARSVGWALTVAFSSHLFPTFQENGRSRKKAASSGVAIGLLG